MLNLTSDNATIANPCPAPKEPVRAAIEDAAVVGGMSAFAILSASAAVQTVPATSIIVSAMIAFASTFLVTYAAKRNIEK